VTRPIRMLRYGTNSERKYISQFGSKFDLLVVNGNMLAYAGSAIAKSVLKMDYIVDPLTHAFQHDSIYLRGKVKNSMRKMANAYGNVILDKLEARRVLRPTDLSRDHGQVDEFVANVIQFQKDHVSACTDDQGYNEYIEYAQIDLTPKWLITPYFFMNSRTFDDWIDVNVMMLESAKRQFPKEPLAAQVVIDKDVLHGVEPDSLVGRYRDSGVEHVFIWIDDFSAFDSSEALLRSYVQIVSKFGQSGIKVCNLYGDYFSVLLCHPDIKAPLCGVCHGMEYGERRQVLPVGGGIPINRYYYPPLHQRLAYPEALLLLTETGIADREGGCGDPERFISEVCGCEVCRDVVGSSVADFRRYGDSKPVIVRTRYGEITRQFPTQEAKDLCIRHFLNSKVAEWDELESRPLSELLEELRQFGGVCGDVLDYSCEATFRIWRRVLEPLSSSS